MYLIYFVLLKQELIMKAQPLDADKAAELALLKEQVSKVSFL
jgi:hypothetical protein